MRDVLKTEMMPNRSSRRARGHGRRNPAATAVLLLAAVLAMTVLLPGTGNIASADPSANDWLRLRNCESGNNYAINTGNGYYGAYQFDLSTWRSVGGTGYPHQASPAVQDALALKLWQQRGWSPWACADIVGLTGSPSAAPPGPAPAPLGSLDVVAASGLAAVVAGWAVDPSSPTTSLDVHVYVNGAGAVRSANKPRADVNGALGIYGQHGFYDSVGLNPGSNNVCVYAIGTAGTNSLLGCRTVYGTVPPAGYVDVMAASGSNVTVNGWAFDPNSNSSSIPVHVYVNGGWGIDGVANLPRGDVNGAFGISGQHGFSITVPGKLSRGANTVCAYAIGVTQGGNNGAIGCRTVQGPQPPIGSLDVVARSGSQAFVAGWAVDPGAPSTSIAVHVYVNSTGRAISADQPRADVNSVVGVSGQHGYSTTVPLQNGANSVCTYAIGVGGNNNTLLGCRSVNYSPQAIEGLQVEPDAAADSARVAAPDPATSFSAAVTGSSAAPTTSPVPPRTSSSTAPAPTTAAPTSTAPTSSVPTAATPTSATTTIPAPTPAGSAAPTFSAAPPSTVLTTPTAVPAGKGGLDPLVVDGLTGTLTGWVAAPVSEQGTKLRVTVNGVTHDVLATAIRTDITQAGLPATPIGFTDAVTLTKGSNEVCVYEIDGDDGISTAPLACRTEQVR